MQSIRKNIPNTITLCNLLCGCIAVKNAFEGGLDQAALFIFLAAIFDFFDGFTARKLGVSSPIGKELDSLADVVSFGLAPATMLFFMLQNTLFPHIDSHTWTPVEFLPYTAFLIAAFSAFRLAKFNLDERQTHGFIGLPTPANALLVIGLTTSLTMNNLLADHLWLLTATALLVVPALCWLLVCEVPMFSFKEGKRWPYAFAIGTLVISEVVARWHPYSGTGLLICMLAYVGIGLTRHYLLGK